MFHTLLQIGEITHLEYGEIPSNLALNYRYVSVFGLSLEVRQSPSTKLFHMQMSTQNALHTYCCYSYDVGYIPYFLISLQSKIPHEYARISVLLFDPSHQTS